MENIHNKIKKQSMGRQKIEIKKIEKKPNLQVTFSKRRSGLFKKVAEFCTLSGSNAAVLVQSPGGKLYAFGNPSPENVINRYLALNNDGHTEVGTEVVKKDDGLCWWRKSVDHMGLEELEEFKNALEDLKSNVMARASQMNMEMTMEAESFEDDFFQEIFS